MTVAASPNPSEAPKPVIVWKVVAPLMVAVPAARAGRACTVAAVIAATTAAAAATTVSFLFLLGMGNTLGIATGTFKGYVFRV
jgi:hypothetical protein